MWDFHEASAPSWVFFVHCFGQRTFPWASACGIFTDAVWHSGTSEKLAHTTSGENDALSPALWKSPQRCASVRRWVCAVLGPARHSLAMVQRFARRRAHMLAASLHIDCACALTGAVHFLDALSCPRDISAWAGVFNDNLQLAGPLDARGFSEAL